MSVFLLFNYAVNISDYIVSDDGMIKQWIGKDMKGAAVA
jgi:hypothetical protein